MFTWDPNYISPNAALSNGNLTATCASTGAGHVRGTSFRSSGKFYMESHCDLILFPSDCALGFMNVVERFSTYLGRHNDSMGWYGDGSVFLNNSVVNTIQSFAQGDIISMAINVTAALVWFRTNNGNWNNDVIANQNPATNIGGISIAATTGPIFPGFEVESATEAATANFGATAYSQSVPSGYLNWETIRTTAPLLFI